MLIVTISFFSFTIYSQFLGKRIHSLTEDHVLTTLSLLKSQYLYTFSQLGGKIIYPLLTELQNNDGVIHAYLFDAQGRVVYPSREYPIKLDSLFKSEELPQGDKILISHIEESGQPIIRSLFSIENGSQCHQCHPSSTQPLGYVVIDFSEEGVKASIDYAKNFGQIFTIFLLLSTIIVMILVHYKFVRKSLNYFRNTITKIEQGDLSERVEIPEQNELGNLAKSFNNMVKQLQLTQAELQLCHQKELLNAQ